MRQADADDAAQAVVQASDGFPFRHAVFPPWSEEPTAAIPPRLVPRGLLLATQKPRNASRRVCSGGGGVCRALVRAAVPDEGGVVVVELLGGAGRLAAVARQRATKT